MSLEHGREGFTLIELSVVLVIIGLVVGGILVGRDLVNAAAVRAQISQIEKYNSAVNTFYAKYGALPGDMPAAAASQFGFVARGTNTGQGDGNGVLEGYYSGTVGDQLQTGEPLLLWQDLGAANLIEGRYSVPGTMNVGAYGALSGSVTASTNPAYNAFIPPAKIAANDYVFAFSNAGINYWGLSSYNGPGPNGITPALCACGQNSSTTYAMTVRQAYDLDKKMDDGLPQSGVVEAVNGGYLLWAGDFYLANAGTNFPNANTAREASSATSCFDNGGQSGATQQYSLGSLADYGSHVNCALVFRMQGAGR